MNISYNWLKQFLKIDWEAKKTAELLTNLGLEVEGLHPFESIRGGLAGVVVGEVLSCIKHPNSDHLKLTTVDIGTDEPLGIICGATNVAAGQKVPVATIGTTLFTKEGTSWTIKKGKIRGEESHGMICAADELGLGEDHSGILVLDAGLKPGTPCSEVFDIEKDMVFEIGLTPNRADAMSHYGVARDLRAGLKQREIFRELNTPSVSKFNITNRSLKMDVVIEKPELAPRYCGLTISNLIVQPSPDWLKNRLLAIGLKPINNIVDATNYVLHELGQPLHSFDAERIFGNKIVVKTLAAGTKFMTLDGQERSLHQDDLMICDSEKPMCIAGVFGGINTGVTEDTKAIFLESAYFDPVSIRQTAKRHGVNTDASFRFERGIDINNVEYALRRAALLIRDLAGGDITSDIVDIYSRKKDNYQVFLTFEKINNLIGQEIKRDTIKSILASLEIQVKSLTETGLGLEIPFYRVDIRREVDVIEEILRVFGYNNIAYGTKLNASIASVSRFEEHRLQDTIGNTLVAQGFFEIICNSLSSPRYNEYLTESEKKGSVPVINPLSNDLSNLRQSLLFSGMETISYNLNRKRLRLKLFEFGKTYTRVEDKYVEDNRLSLLVTGDQFQESWTGAPKQSGFFYLKGMVRALLERSGISDISEVPAIAPYFGEGIHLETENRQLVTLGVVSKAILEEFDIKQDVLFAEFSWDLLMEYAGKGRVTFHPIPKYPEVRRNMAVLLNEGTRFEELYHLARNAGQKLLKQVHLFDVYTGENLPEGKKSYALSFTIQDEKKTLTDPQIDKIMKKIQQSFEKELGAVLR